MPQRPGYEYESSTPSLYMEDTGSNTTNPDSQDLPDVPSEVMAGGQEAYEEWLRKQQQDKNSQQVQPMQNPLTSESTISTGNILNESNIPAPSNIPPGGGKPGLHPNQPSALNQPSVPAPKQGLIPPKPFSWSRLPKLKRSEPSGVEMPTHTVGIRG